MTAPYLDSSAFVKVLVDEPESWALRAFLASNPTRRVSSTLLRVEALRAVRNLGSDTLAAIREGPRRVDLIGIDDWILDAAGAMEPRILCTLDAIHLATALALGDDLDAIVTYDDQMTGPARLLGVPSVRPG